MGQKHENTNHSGLEIAVIGMSGRFPGASGIERFWRNLEQGIESITFYSEQDLADSGVDAALLGNPSYVKGGGALADKDLFDAFFFGYIPNEAQMMDPQMRVFHEVVWEALEDAAHVPETFKGLIGLYAGAAHSFGWEAMVKLSGATAEYGQFEVGQLTDKDFLCTRISYKLNLDGPSVAVQSACSTSLVAVHMACRALLTGECGMAIAGGVTILSSKGTGYLYQEGMTLSPDGHCRAFDAGANGTVSGEGAGAVVLRRLKDAVAGRDHIYAVVKSSAINNDGVRKVGFTAPSVEGQAQVIRKALRLAKVNVETIGYIETHGTGTALGDPVEVEALRLAFKTEKRQYCSIGSVKTNVGHLNSAAGVTGFIKAALSIYHRCIPASLHFKTPNPKIDFAVSPFYVNTKTRHWENTTHPLRAGVSSFGIGGTNAHAILEEPPVIRTKPELLSQSYYLLLLSARGEKALDEMTKQLKDHWEANPDLEPADISYTLAAGRRHFSLRSAIVCSGTEHALTAMSNHCQGKGEIPFTEAGDQPRSLIFMFPGLGAQFPGMCRGIYDRVPFFRQCMDRCLDHLETLGVKEIKSLYTTKDNMPEDFENPLTGQALLFCVSFSLASLLIHWGMTPSAMIGYSFGEYVSATIAGVLTPEQALRLIVSRATLLPAIPAGKMLSVPLPSDEMSSILFGSLSLAIDNGPSVIVSGTSEDIDVLTARLKEKRLMCMEVPNPYPLHSPLVETALEHWNSEFTGIDAGQPKIPYISNVSGNWISEAEACDPGYWGRHLSSTVRFADGIGRLLDLPNPVFVEVGPGRDLNALLQRFLKEEKQVGSISLARSRELDIDDYHYLLKGIGRLWKSGIEVDWETFWENSRGRRVSLPTYPFQRQQYWIDRKELEAHWNRMTNGIQLSGKKEIEQWFYLPQWLRAPVKRVKQVGDPKDPLWALFLDPDRRDSFGDALLRELEHSGHSPLKVLAGNQYTNSDGFDKLAAEISGGGRRQCNILYLWTLEEQTLYGDFFSLVHLARSLANFCPDIHVNIAVLTRSLHCVTGEEEIIPRQATLLGPVRVIPREYPLVHCCNIDLPNIGTTTLRESELARSCIHEFSGGMNDPVVALRGEYRWRLVYESFPIEEVECKEWMAPHAVVLITGGLGGIGFQVALHLARRFQARLVLTGRRDLPPKQEWGQLADGWRREMVDRIQKLEAAGGDVMYESCDVCDSSAMKIAVNRAIDRFGIINGVIHIAGIADYEGIIQKRSDPTGSVAVMDPKVKGMRSLERALKDSELDFVILFSSIASILAPFGQVAYTAANAFLDAEAFSRNRGNRTRWLSIAWDAWRDTGMAAEAKGQGEGMAPVQALEALERVMGAPQKFSSCAIFSNDLASHLRHLDEVVEERRQELNREETTVSSDNHKRERPESSSPYAAPEGELEKAMILVWEDFFGVKQLGVDDDFFELGGDSLKAMTLSARIHKSMNARIPLTQFFKTFTVRGLCRYISHQRNEEYKAIEPAPPKDYYALSSAQKRLFILQQMEPESVAYNMPTVMEVRGLFDPASCGEIFRQLIARHEIFRTSFHMVGGVPMQQIGSHVDFELDFVDLAAEHGEIDGYSPEVREIIRRFTRPFRMNEAPLLRAGLVSLGNDRSVFMMDMHHIISDLVTIEIFVSEFTSILMGKALEPLTIHYKDYAEWQHSPQIRNILEQQENFWKEAFSPMPPLLELPLDFSRPPVQSFAGASRSMVLEEDMTEEIRSLSKRLDVTMYMVSLALMTAWLAKLSGQEDIVVGTPVSARRHADLERCMGMFVNMVVLRNFPEDNLPFDQFLRRVKAGALAAFENQEYPYEDLVETLKISRDVSRNPLCDVVLVYQEPGKEDLESEDIRAGGLSMSRYQEENTSSKFDLTLTVIMMDRRLFVRLEYCTCLFKASTVERFLEYFKNLTDAVVTNPSLPLSEIDILPDHEKEELLRGLNSHGADYPMDDTIVERFKRVTLAQPNSVAVLEPDGGQVCYGELDRRAGVVTNTLLQYGMTNESIVALLLEPSADMVAVILGSLYAGCGYLPIDIFSPEARIDFILKDSHCRLLVNQSIADQHSNTGVLHKISLDQIPWRQEPHTELPIDVESTSLAYIIYTSGTTGRPKGVMVQHNNVVQLLFGLGFPFDFGNDDIWTMFHSYSFDFSVWEMYGALLRGGRLVTVPGPIARAPDAFSHLLVRYGVTILNQTPSAFFPLADRMLEYNCQHQLRWIIFGGEALAPARLASWNNAWPGVKLANMFGITETTVHVTFRAIGQNEIENGISDIGKPLDTLTTTISNRSGKLTPPGVAGELWVGGAGVARGYLNRPDLTGQKFISHPYAPHRRIYRSGDLVRLRNGGNMEYLGRIDHQVKIRGYRIELAEIERQLLSHESVTGAVALARNLGAGHRDLVGYVECGSNVELEKLREYLGRQLPGYMIPAQLVRVDEIPLTPNGKIDRRSLLKMDVSGNRPTRKNRGLQNNLQRVIGKIWKQVIPVDDVDIYDNFFDIGGNSLSIIQVGTRIREELGAEIPVMILFEHPTIESLAHFMQSFENKEESDRKVVDKSEAKKIAGKSRRLQQEKRRKGRLKE